MEMLSIEEVPWDGNHHRSSFLPSLDEVEKDIHFIFLTVLSILPNLQYSPRKPSPRGIWETSLLRLLLTSQ
jgi:hypothetical protein